MSVITAMPSCCRIGLKAYNMKNYAFYAFYEKNEFGLMQDLIGYFPFWVRSRRSVITVVVVAECKMNRFKGFI